MFRIYKEHLHISVKMELQEWENTGKWQACDRIPNFTSRQENEK